MQLTGEGLVWSVAQQTAFLLAVQKAASFSNVTQYGFGNISDSALSFPEVLAAVSPSSPQSRRRLLGTRPLPPSQGRLWVNLGGESDSGSEHFHQRSLLQIQAAEASVDVYLRLTTEHLNQTAAEYWQALFLPQGSNPGTLKNISCRVSEIVYLNIPK